MFNTSYGRGSACPWPTLSVEVRECLHIQHPANLIVSIAPWYRVVYGTSIFVSSSSNLPGWLSADAGVPFLAVGSLWSLGRRAAPSAGTFHQMLLCLILDNSQNLDTTLYFLAVTLRYICTYLAYHVSRDNKHIVNGIRSNCVHCCVALLLSVIISISLLSTKRGTTGTGFSHCNLFQRHIVNFLRESAFEWGLGGLPLRWCSFPCTLANCVLWCAFLLWLFSYLNTFSDKERKYKREKILLMLFPNHFLNGNFEG